MQAIYRTVEHSIGVHIVSIEYNNNILVIKNLSHNNNNNNNNNNKKYTGNKITMDRII